MFRVNKRTHKGSFFEWSEVNLVNKNTTIEYDEYLANTWVYG